MDPWEAAVPHSLDAVFGKRMFMGELVNKFLYLRAKIEALRTEPCGSKLDFDALCYHFDHIQVILSNAIPYAQCGCQTQPCPVCLGTRWISSGEYLAARATKQHLGLKASYRKSPFHATFMVPPKPLPVLQSEQTKMCMSLLQDWESQNESPPCESEPTSQSEDTLLPTNGKPPDSPTEP
jgi:hypothetical protein